MDTWHGYITLENIALTPEQVQIALNVLHQAGTQVSSQPAYLTHYRLRPDGQAVLAESAWIADGLRSRLWVQLAAQAFSVEAVAVDPVQTANGERHVVRIGGNDAFALVIHRSAESDTHEQSRQLAAAELDALPRVWTRPTYWHVDPDFSTDALPQAARTWYDASISAFQTPHASFDWWGGGFNGDLYAAARSLWFSAAGALGAFYATGSAEMLHLVASLVERVFDFMADVDDDGYRELIYLRDDGTPLYRTDNGMDANLLASWLTCAGYVLDVNRTTDSRFATCADAVKTWTFEDYLPELVAEGSSAPAAPDDQMHTWSRGALWLHFLDKWTGFGAYQTRLANGKAVVFNALNVTFVERPNGSLVWDHRPYGRGWWGLQPSVYAGDTLISLVLLALDGAIDRAMLPKLAKTVAQNVFGGTASFDGERDVGGHVVLDGEPFPVGNSDTFPLMNASRFRQTGFPALAAWDDSGVIKALAETAQATSTNELALPGWMVFAEVMSG